MNHPPSEPRTLWVILSPIFKPAPGGAAVYYDTIGRAIAKAGDDVLVLCEAFAGTPQNECFHAGNGTARVDRFLPFRAGRAEKDWRSYVDYAIANALYLRIPSLIRRAHAQGDYARVCVIMHTSLLYNPSTLAAMLPRLRRAVPGKTRLIADIRDYSYPQSKLPLLKHFDAIVTSSLGVAEELGKREPAIADRLRPIAMPFAPPPPPSDETVAAVLARFGLARGRYLFNPNGIADNKHFPAMREAMPLLRQMPGCDDLVLVTAGRNRDWTARDDEAEAAGITRYIGPVPHADIVALMRGAHATVILSDREAISRGALEAMSVGGRVILPDLAEFRANCAEAVCSNVEPAAIAALAASLASRPPHRFPFENHAEPVFLPAYRALDDRGRRDAQSTESETGTAPC